MTKNQNLILTIFNPDSSTCRVKLHRLFLLFNGSLVEIYHSKNLNKLQLARDAHEPKDVATIFTGILKDEGFEVELLDTLEAYEDLEKLKNSDLIVPHLTMGEIK